LLAVALLATGCAASRDQIVRALRTDPPGPELPPPESGYTVACPDALWVEVRGERGWSGGCRVEPDGRITAGPIGSVRVEGLTTEQVAGQVAGAAGVDRAAVAVQVTEYNRRRLFLFGGGGTQRAVPYRGPETVVDLLRRTDALEAGAALNEVHVVRGHVADGRAPEVYPVDLAAIALGHDPRTNVVLEPFDQVYVGETRRSRLRKLMPAWMRPAYQTVCGITTPRGEVARAAGP
jgi:protein involved in polysaccharide export with SLBB domain